MATRPGLVRALTVERAVAALLPGVSSTDPASPATPVPALPALNLALPSTFQHGAGRIDDHGRLRDASLFSALGWDSTTRLTFVSGDGQAVVRVASDGVERLDSRGRLRLPLSVRRGLSAEDGQTVLLSATSDGVLVISPGSLLDRLVARVSA